MPAITQAERASRLRSLHHGPRILILPNAWDAASARIFEDAGFPAIGTTSAGIANSLGYPDGERIGREEMIEYVRLIADAVEVPVTADMEAGFGATIDDVVETTREVLAAGAVGINLEDSTDDPQHPLVEVSFHVEKIKAVREAADREGVPIVINARTDVYLSGVGEPASRFEHAVARANAYRDAGADCLFVPSVDDAVTIERLAREIRGPINVLARAGVPAAPELERLGVARVSLGSGPMRAAMTVVRRIAQELLTSGTYAAFTEGAISYAELNRLMERPPADRDASKAVK